MPEKPDLWGSLCFKDRGIGASLLEVKSGFESYLISVTFFVGDYFRVVIMSSNKNEMSS